MDFLRDCFVKRLFKLLIFEMAIFFKNNNMKKRIFILYICCVICLSTAKAQDGTLDSSFGVNGIVTGVYSWSNIDPYGASIPGSINDETSALSDSFQDDLISPPVYTRPAEYKTWKVPEILLSGHEKKIDEWKLKKSIERTKQRRPDMID